jgi:putative PIN family toxin of toxin-antitoxin system
LRVVLDTNVWVSGLLLPTSNAGKILKGWDEARFEVILSSYILEEIGKVLAYPKIKKRLEWDGAKIQHYLDLLVFFAEIVDVPEISAHVEADPNDSPILSALITSDADFLVSGDSDLSDLKIDCPVLSIVEFLQKLEG